MLKPAVKQRPGKFQMRVKQRFHLIGNLESELILQTDVSKAKLCMCGKGIIIGVVLLL